MLSKRQKMNDVNENNTSDEADIDINPTLLTNIINTLKKYIRFAFNISIIYFVWLSLHYISVYLYGQFCVPLTLYGILLSPLLISSLHCKALRWVLYTGASTIDTMWIVFGTWVSSKLLTRE